jgi:hypothetical protein
MSQMFIEGKKERIEYPQQMIGETQQQKEVRQNFGSLHNE